MLVQQFSNFWAQDLFTFLQIIEDPKDFLFMWNVFIDITVLEIKTDKFKNMIYSLKNNKSTKC